MMYCKVAVVFFCMAGTYGYILGGALSKKGGALNTKGGPITTPWYALQDLHRSPVEVRDMQRLSDIPRSHMGKGLIDLRSEDCASMTVHFLLPSSGCSSVVPERRGDDQAAASFGEGFFSPDVADSTAVIGLESLEFCGIRHGSRCLHRR